MIREIQNRRSIRRYKDTPVTDAELFDLLEAARLAPSAGNTQPWQFVVVRDAERRRQLAEAAHNQPWMAEAPLFLVAVADSTPRFPDREGLRLDEGSAEAGLKMIVRDTAIAIEHILLEAEHLGLGSCWIAWFVQDDIRPILGIPEDQYVVGILTIGHKAEEPPARPRKPLDAIVHYETW